MVGKEDPNGLIEVLAIPHDPKMKAMEICRILREELGLISLSEFNGRVREQKMLVFMEVKRAKRILDECEPKVEDIDTSAPDFARKNRIPPGVLLKVSRNSPAGFPTRSAL